MKRIVIMTKCIIGLIFLFQSVDVFSQVDCVTDVPPEYEENVSAWDDKDESIMRSPFHVNRLTDTYAVDIAKGHIDRVAYQLVARFLEEDWGPYASKQALIETQLTEILASLVGATEYARQGRTVSDAENNKGLNDDEINRFVAKFGGRLPQLEIVEGDVGSRYFVDTDSEILIYEPCDGGGSFRLLLPVRELRQWRLLSHTLQTMVDKTISEIRKKNVESLRQSVASWESFFANSYSQMPWESWLNGRYIDRPNFGPPDKQLIFLHPSFGVELGTGSFDDLKVNETLLIELFGRVWYNNPDYQKYLGVSAALALRSNANPGIGVVAHVRKNWSVGVAWHRELDGPQLFLSVDLFRYARTEADQYRSKLEDQKDALEEIFGRK